MLEAKLTKQRVIETYTGNAKVYDLWAAMTETKARQVAVSFAAPQGGETLLEVAVGTGLTFADLVERNPQGENYGIDITPAMLAKAELKMQKRGFSNYQLALGDAEQLEFNDDTFDLVVNNYMFDLLPEEKFLAVLTEFKRVLKPTGRLVLTNMAVGKKRFHRFYDRVYRINPAWMGGCRGVQLETYLKQAGFEITDYRYLAQLGFPSEIIRATVD